MDSFRNTDIGYAAAGIHEAMERLFDLLKDVPQQIMDFEPGGSNLTIGRLAKHMIWAQAGWVYRTTGVEAPGAIQEAVADGNLGGFTEAPREGTSAEELIRLGGELERVHSLPCLEKLEDPEAPLAMPLKSGKGPATVKQALLHLAWHWTYHSAHVGLIRLLAGSDYNWSF